MAASRKRKLLEDAIHKLEELALKGTNRPYTWESEYAAKGFKYFKDKIVSKWRKVLLCQQPLSKADAVCLASLDLPLKYSKVFGDSGRVDTYVELLTDPAELREWKIQKLVKEQEELMFRWDKVGDRDPEIEKRMVLIDRELERS